MLNMRLNVHRYCQHGYSDYESTKRPSRKPSPLLAERETQCERGQSKSQHHRTKRIKTLVLLPVRALLLIKVKPGEENKYADWNIDIKDPTPGQILGNDSSQSRPGTHTQRDHDRIQAQGYSSLINWKDTREHGHI